MDKAYLKILKFMNVFADIFTRTHMHFLIPAEPVAWGRPALGAESIDFFVSRHSMAPSHPAVIILAIEDTAGPLVVFNLAIFFCWIAVWFSSLSGANQPFYFQFGTPCGIQAFCEWLFSFLVLQASWYEAELYDNCETAAGWSFDCVEKIIHCEYSSNSRCWSHFVSWVSQIAITCQCKHGYAGI